MVQAAHLHCGSTPEGAASPLPRVDCLLSGLQPRAANSTGVITEENDAANTQNVASPQRTAIPVRVL